MSRVAVAVCVLVAALAFAGGWQCCRLYEQLATARGEAPLSPTSDGPPIDPLPPPPSAAAD